MLQQVLGKPRMRVCVRAAAPPAVGSSQRWQVSLYTSTPSIRSVLPTNQPSKPPSDIRLSFVDRQSGNKRDSVNVGGWAAEKWRRDDDERMTGLKRTGQVDLTNIQPGAVLVQKLDSDGGYPDVDLVSYVELTRPGAGDALVFPAHSWVSSEHGQRVFFEGSGTLPSDTPPGLQDLRKQELAEKWGENKPGVKDAVRSGADRVYDYDVYNNLGRDGQMRQPLGGSDDLPYPRRLRTGRKIVDGTETPVPFGDKP
eukprot:jgi/Chrzof1/11160/Cz05g26050.t1